MVLLTGNGLDLSCVRVFIAPDTTTESFWQRVLHHHRSSCEQPLAVVTQNRKTDSWAGESETCIKNCEAIFDYVLSGKILYSVRNAAGAVGTAAFQLQDGCKVVLVELLT